jgi:hypothetical protein
VSRLKARFATFLNGGWFGPTNSGPASGGHLTAAHLVEPLVQVTTDGILWTTVPHTSDYFTMLPGHRIGDGGVALFTMSPPATFTLATPAQNITGVRLIGLEGGSAEGFLGLFDLTVNSGIPAGPADPDTDNDGLPDAWEIQKFGNIAAQDADDDLDNDGSNALLEYGFNMNPNASDFPPAAVLEGNYLTLTITKRPFVTHSIVSGSTLLDFSTMDTTTLINDATTLKVRDNFSITGPAVRRFLRATVMAVP